MQDRCLRQVQDAIAQKRQAEGSEKQTDKLFESQYNECGACGGSSELGSSIVLSRVGYRKS